MEAGLSLQTVCYRAPEVCFGDRNFSYPIDSWSLGCVLAELILRRPLFDAASNIQNMLEVLRFGGTEVARGSTELCELPFFSSQLPNFPPQPWPPTWLPRWRGPHMERFLSIYQGLLQLVPSSRWLLQLAKDRCFGFAAPEVVFKNAKAERGAFTMVATAIDETLLQWLRTDPAFKSNFCALFQLFMLSGVDDRATCMGPEELNLKVEIGGYVSEEQPNTPTCNSVDCSKPFFFCEADLGFRAGPAAHERRVAGSAHRAGPRQAPRRSRGPVGGERQVLFHNMLLEDGIRLRVVPGNEGRRKA